MNIWQTLPKPFTVLAPMDDVTDVVFRSIVAECTPPDIFFTEFVNVDGLQSPGRAKLLPKLQKGEHDRPIIAQIWGLKPENFEKTAADIVAMGFYGVDINFGCPDKTVVKNGACSAMINNRPLAAEIIAATKRGAAGKIPVSVKTRLGFTQIDFTWHEFLLQQGIDALTVHFRTRKEMSKVDAHWDLAPEVVALRNKLAPNTVLIGNGDVRNRDHATQLAATYGLDGVMIGRGVFQDPFCFAANSPWEATPKEQKLAIFKKQVELFAATWPNGERKLHTLNKFCKIYVNGFEGASELRSEIMNAHTVPEILSFLP